jgi:serine/threonine-protein kinase
LTPERWQQLEDIYQAALDLDPRERPSFLEIACGGDEELRAEIESLLAHAGETVGALDVPACERGRPLLETETGRLDPGARLGRFEIVNTIGSGGMGQVYRAKDTHLGRSVAIKVLPPGQLHDPQVKRRFFQEARAASALNHSNVVTIHDAATHDDVDYLVLELVDGESLDRRMRTGNLDPTTALDYAAQTASALAAAHAAGIVHRDIKPANLMITPTGSVKVLDFGIAKLTETAGPLADTLPGTVTGTVAYMSPEQAEGLAVDGRSDIFSLGIVLYEMLTGIRPFERPTRVSTLHAIVSEDPPPLADSRQDIPASCDAVVRKALAKSPRDRYQNAASLERDLRRVIQEWTAPPRANAPQRAPASGRRGCESIAVLPFLDLSANRDQDYFCEGLAEEIISSLAGVEGLRVASRSASFQFRREATDPHQIGRTLDVAAILEGSVRKSGRRLRITVELVRTSDRFHIWSQRFDKEEEDIFAIQDEVASAVVAVIAPNLRRVAPPRRAVDPKAYELYLRGRYFWNRRPGAVVLKALEAFQKAVEIDPDYAAAHAGIADVYATLGSWEAGVVPPMEALARARSAAERALVIDPRLAEAYSSLGYVVQHFEWNLAEAEQLFQKAMALNPSYTGGRHWHSHCLIASGRFADSLRESQAALELEPVDLVLTFHMAWHYQMARQADMTLEWAGRVIEMDPKLHWGHYFLASGYELKREFSRAIDGFREACNLSSDNPVMKAWLGHALALAGDRSSALAIAEEIRTIGETRGHFAYEAAVIHGALGDNERAFELLEKARVQRSGWMSYLLVDPRLDLLRSDSRFPEFLGAVALIPDATQAS